MMHMPSIPSGSIATVGSEAGNASPQLSVRSTATGSETLLAAEENEQINLQIFVPELQIQKCLTVALDEIVWDIKRKLFVSLPQALPQSFNFGLFLPPCDGRAGKFLLEDRPIRDYPFHDCVPYVELKYKKRVYKMLKLDEKALKQLHSKSNLKKFMDYVHSRNAEKVEKWCTQGLDPNFHDSQGETPLTVAAGVANNRDVLIQLVGGGAHLDFRNSEGQTGLHKAAFLSIPENVNTLLELGGSPNYRDPIGLTPLYYCMLTTDAQDVVAEMLLSEAAEVGIQDMHGNHELHQACKNGLMKHVEHLLYYGADINAQNVNGNTPLHVCAVNNRPECARVLLFRGADPMIVNKQNQTALHVAHIVGNLAVADVIQGHNPQGAVPYRGTPKYNTRRRLGSQILRRRSLSQSSMCSAQSQGYQTPQLMRHSAVPPAASPNPSIGTLRTAPPSEYGTLRRYPPDAVQAARAGYEPNVPRILVIPRGPKGFGFILRGAKHVDSEVDFEPTPAVPALQFFEGVDMSGMAMKAGLRPGDFLLEINGVDVRRASHEQVVHLIHQSDDTITLKVITIDSALPTQASQSHYAAGYGGTISARSRNHSVPRNGHLPPMPPQRHPATSLSFARGSAFHHSMSYSMDGDQTDHSNGASPVPNGNYAHAPGASSFSNSPSTNSSFNTSTFASPARLPASKSMDHMPDAGAGMDAEQLRCASVKSRPSAARRISAAELEHLMIRQGTSASQFQAIPYDQDPVSVQGPKKFTSVAEMKRRKQQKAAMNGEADIYQQHQPLKSFKSMPPDGRIYDASSSGPGEAIYGDPRHPRRPSTDSEYSRPNRTALRPKTPPPPPPQMRNGGSETIYAPTAQRAPPPAPPAPPCPPCDYDTTQASSSKPTSAPPAPPPPPPPDFLKSGGVKPANSAGNGTGNRPALQAPAPPSAASKPSDANGADCRGISAAALCAVRLKPVGSAEKSGSSEETTALSKGPAGLPPTASGTLKKNVDFDSDLRNALAKRRSKVCHDDDENGRSQSQSPANGVEQGKPTVSATTVGRYGGLSLRESVRENVQPSTKGSSKLHQHSPPTGFVAKKDSGYTSSRTSLEPESECGDETTNPPPPTLAPTTIKIVDPSAIKGADKNGMAASPSPPELLLSSAGSSHRVTLISRQLEDTYGSGGAKAAKSMQQDTISVSSTLSNLSSCSRTPSAQTHNGRPLFLENPSRTPPVDYEDPDSGTGDSDHETTISSLSGSGASTSVATAPSSVTDVECNTPNGTCGIEYRRKELASWSVNDVADWLSDLNLGEYVPTFRSHCITGVQLQRFDRARFTQLGVTRIGHRQAMEVSLKDFSKS